MESTPLRENRRTIPQHWTVLGLLVVLHAIVGAAYFLKGIPEIRFYSEAGEGFISSQPFLFAFWAAFAPQRFYHRFLWSLFFCILVSFTVDYGRMFPLDRPLGLLMLMDVAFFLIATFLLLPVRRFSGWQIKMLQEDAIAAEYQTYQFGIKHLILLMTVAAIGFGLFRSLYLLNSPSAFPFSSNFVQVLIFHLPVNLPVMLLAWLVLAKHRHFIISLIAVLLFVAVLDFVINAIPKSNSLVYSDLINICLIQLGAALSVLLSTLVMRFCGFRMVRVRKSVASVGEE